MKVVVGILVVLVSLILLVLGIAYLDGSTLPVDHSITVTGLVPAPPEQVFARIVDVAHGNTWRPQVKSVIVLPPDNGRDHWVEDFGHGTTMPFLAIRTDVPTRREVLLDDRSAPFGGTWVYQLSPGPSPNSTSLRITENGYINPPIYRFVMAHMRGMTHNQEVYLSDLQRSFSGR